MNSVENKFNNLPKLAKIAKGREWVYFVRADCEARLIKIGHSVNLKWRLSGLQTQCPVQLSLVGLVQAPAGTEFVLHEALAESRAHGEWFRPTADLESVRRQLPKAGAIEVSDLVSVVEPLGVSEDRVREILVWSLSTQKHLGTDEEPMRKSHVQYKIDQMVKPPIDLKALRKRLAAIYADKT